MKIIPIVLTAAAMAAFAVPTASARATEPPTPAAPSPAASGTAASGTAAGASQPATAILLPKITPASTGSPSPPASPPATTVQPPATATQPPATATQPPATSNGKPVSKTQPLPIAPPASCAYFPLATDCLAPLLHSLPTCPQHIWINEGHGWTCVPRPTSSPQLCRPPLKFPMSSGGSWACLDLSAPAKGSAAGPVRARTRPSFG